MNHDIIHNCEDRQPEPATREVEIIVKMSDAGRRYSLFGDQPIMNAAGPMIPIRFCPFCGLDLVEEQKKVK
jgi:hypothetical protein